MTSESSAGGTDFVSSNDGEEREARGEELEHEAREMVDNRTYSMSEIEMENGVEVDDENEEEEDDEVEENGNNDGENAEVDETEEESNSNEECETVKKWMGMASGRKCSSRRSSEYSQQLAESIAAGARRGLQIFFAKERHCSSREGNTWTTVSFYRSTCYFISLTNILHAFLTLLTLFMSSLQCENSSYS